MDVAHLKYCVSHSELKRIAHEFKGSSAVDFDVCTGAIDGVLIWIQKPVVLDAKRVKMDQHVAKDISMD